MVAFIVPFAFAYDSELLLQGNWLAIAGAVGSAAMAAYLLSVGFAGYFKIRPALWSRIVMIAAGCLCFAVSWPARLLGLAIGIAMIVLLVTKKELIAQNPQEVEAGS